MNKVIKSIMNDVLNEDIERFLLRSAGGTNINTNEVYLVLGEENLALITSSIRIPDTSFFIDILNKRLISSYDLAGNLDKNFTFKLLSDEISKSSVTLDEISQIVENKRQFNI